MLKTLALLEAQKIQATKVKGCTFTMDKRLNKKKNFNIPQDLEQLVVVKTRALRDPARFVTALKNGVSHYDILCSIFRTHRYI